MCSDSCVHLCSPCVHVFCVHFVFTQELNTCVNTCVHGPLRCVHFRGFTVNQIADLQYSTDLTAPETAFKPLSIRV